MKRITLVKKILADGSPCKKCKELLYKLEVSGHIERIYRTVIAQEGDLQSDGYLLAQKHQQENAPFFIIEHENGNIETISTYGDFLKTILSK